MIRNESKGGRTQGKRNASAVGPVAGSPCIGGSAMIHLCLECGSITAYSHVCTVCRSSWIEPIRDAETVGTWIKSGAGAVVSGLIDDGEVC